MSLSSRISVAAVLAAAFGLVVVACSAASDLPAESGDCVATADARCGAPDPGGGGGSGPTHSDSGTTTAMEASSTCGAAVAFFTTNTTCVPCIEGETAGILGCCAADLACSGQAACFSLLQCILACNVATDPTCPDNCENANPTGVTAYDDLSNCFSSQCSPQCPTLAQGGTADF